VNTRFIADTIVVFHLVFIAFVVVGGVLALWRRGAALVHLPALAWGAWAEFTGAICPLTPLENGFRHAAGEVGVSGSFVEHYLVPLIYPAALTPHTQAVFGGVLLAINAGIYLFVWRSRRRQRSGRRASPLPTG
jgi:hypothetical protein